MVYVSDAIIIQLIGILVVLMGSVFVFMPEKARIQLQKCAKKTNEIFKFKGIILIIIGAVLIFFGIN